MSSFTDNLEYKFVGGSMYEITKPVRFYIDDDFSGEYVELFEGALTNFASIPKFAQIISKPDQEDVKMTSAFHDLMVCEFGQQIPIMRNGMAVRIPDWNESAFWFRVGMKVRQKQTRKHLPWLNEKLISFLDFSRRWLFWTLVVLHGFLRNKK